VGLYQGNKVGIYGDILEIIRLFGLCGPVLGEGRLFFMIRPRWLYGW